jgi:prolyl-tRNA synthetase
MNFREFVDCFMGKKRTSKNGVLKLIKEATKGLYYMSETDEEVEAFFGGKIENFTKEAFLKIIGRDATEPIEERDFEQFFERLIKIQDWYGEQEIETAKRYKQLQKILKENLRDLKVYRIGRIEIDIYVIGIDSQNNLMGIKTKAVET